MDTRPKLKLQKMLIDFQNIMWMTKYVHFRSFIHWHIELPYFL